MSFGLGFALELGLVRFKGFGSFFIGRGRLLEEVGGAEKLEIAPGLSVRFFRARPHEALLERFRVDDEVGRERHGAALRAGG